MKTRFLFCVLPLVVVGGMTLFPGCGAEAPQVHPVEKGTPASSSAAATPSDATNPAGATVQAAPAARPAVAPPALSAGVDEVVQLAQAGVGDDVLQAYIENSKVEYKMTVEEILYLHDLGLSAETIATMVRHSQMLQETSAAVAAAVPGAPASATNPPAPVAAVAPETNPVTAQAAPAPAIATAPNAYVVTPPQQVNDNYFYQALSPYGTWVQVPEYGWCWQPTVAVVDAGWQPYCNRGRWLWTDSGWYWQSDYSWGWAPFHYGRWWRSPRVGWVWVPDTTWGPAWVTWRYADTYCGWAPLPPGACYDVGVGFTFGGGHVGVGFDFGLGYDCFTFIPTIYFCDRTPWYYCLPRHQIVAVWNHTRVINNYAPGPGGRHVIHVGPGTNAIASVARSEIRKVRLHDTTPVAGNLIKGDRLDRDGKTLEVFRPSLPKQASAPPQEITRRQQELRKRSDSLARSEAPKWTGGASPSGGSAERGLPARGTPLSSARPITGDARLPGVEGVGSTHVVAPSRPGESPRGTPLISNNPRLERRNPDSAPTAGRGRSAFEADPASRPLAEASAAEPPSFFRGERVRDPARNSHAEPRQSTGFGQPAYLAEPSRPVPQASAPGQVITPPVQREESRRAEPAPANRYSPPPTQGFSSPGPGAIPPRSDAGFNAPAYRPPPGQSQSYPQQNYSRPSAPAPRAIEVPSSRPSSPPPSYSPPPAASRPQPAPSQSPPRNEGGRRQP